MVFSNLPPTEKDAFFSLLDEYFSSRPALLSSPASGPAAAAAASAVHSAFTNSSPSSTTSSIASKFSAPSHAAVGALGGRVAAASRAFSSAPHDDAPAAPPPAMPPRRGSAMSNSPGTPSPPSPSPPPPALAAYNRPQLSTGSGSDSTGKLVSMRKFGDVDTTSGKAMFLSIKNGTANKSKVPSPVAPPIPAAFPKKSGFAPPPRRVVSAAPSTPDPEPEPEPEPEPQEEEQHGAWAEALYDYESEEADDLQIRAGQRVLVTDAKTSPDWWTGMADGKSGLFPASYVKML